MQTTNVKVSVKVTVRDCPRAKNIEKKKSLHLLVIDAQLGFQIIGQRFKIRVNSIKIIGLLFQNLAKDYQ